MEYPNDYRRFLKAHAFEDWQRERPNTDQARGLPSPPVQKPYPEDARFVDLIPAEDITLGSMPIKDVIAKRRSRRIYTDEPLSLEELSYLLWATQGVSRTVETPDGPKIYRTVPSGSARHTFETYLVINRVTGVEPGLYRYIPLEHKLMFMRSDPDLPKKLAAACHKQDFVGKGAVIFIWTTIPYRMEWRYSIASHKPIALDSGHLCQNLYLAAESIGGGTCGIAAYYQKEVDAILGVDGEDEFTIYAAPVGKVE